MISAISDALARNCPKSIAINKYRYKTMHFLLGSGGEYGSQLPFLTKHVKKLFPNMVTAGKESPDMSRFINKTKEISKTAKTIFLPIFGNKKTWWYADIMEKEENGFRLYLLCEYATITADCINECAYIFYMAKLSDIPISGISVIYLNANYIKQGRIEPEKLFIFTDVTNQVLEKQDFISKNIDALLEKGSQKTVLNEFYYGSKCILPSKCLHFPDCRIKSYKRLNNIEELLFIDDIGAKVDSLIGNGITSIHNIPDGFDLTKHQKQHIKAMKIGNYYDSKYLRKFIASKRTPECFYEITFANCTIPIFNGSSPFQKHIRKYSVYIPQKSHKMYYTEPLLPKSSVKKTCSSFIKDTAEYKYFATYDKNSAKSAFDVWAKVFPEYKERLDYIISNTLDLAIPIYERRIHHQNRFYDMTGWCYIFPTLVWSDTPLANNYYAQLLENLGKNENIDFDRLSNGSAASLYALYQFYDYLSKTEGI